MRIIKYCKADSNDINPSELAEVIDADIYIYGESGSGKTTLMESASGINRRKFILSSDYTKVNIKTANATVRFNFYINDLKEKKAGLAFYGEIRLVLLDMTKPNAFDEFRSWWEFASGYLYPNCSIIMLATKADLVDQHQVSMPQVIDYAITLDKTTRQFAGVVFVNAQDDSAVADLFQLLAQECLWHKKKVETAPEVQDDLPWLESSRAVVPKAKKRFSHVACFMSGLPSYNSKLKQTEERVLESLLQLMLTKPNNMIMPGNGLFVLNADKINQTVMIAKTIHEIYCHDEFEHYCSENSLDEIIETYMETLTEFVAPQLCVLIMETKNINSHVVPVFAYALFLRYGSVAMMDDNLNPIVIPIGPITENTTLAALTLDWLRALKVSSALFYFKEDLYLNRINHADITEALASLDKNQLILSPDNVMSEFKPRHLSHDESPFQQWLRYYLEAINNSSSKPSNINMLVNYMQFVERKYMILKALLRELSLSCFSVRQMESKTGRDLRQQLMNNIIAAVVSKKLNGLAAIHQFLKANITEEPLSLKIRHVALDIYFMMGVHNANTISELKIVYSQRAYIRLPQVIDRQVVAINTVQPGSMLFTFYYLNQHQFPQVNHVQLLNNIGDDIRVLHAYIGKNKRQVAVTPMAKQPAFYWIYAPNDISVLKRVQDLMHYCARLGWGFDFNSMRQTTIEESRRLYGPTVPPNSNHSQMLIANKKDQFNQSSLENCVRFLIQFLMPQLRPEKQLNYFCSSLVLLLYQSAYLLPKVKMFVDTELQESKGKVKVSSLVHSFFYSKSTSLKFLKGVIPVSLLE